MAGANNTIILKKPQQKTEMSPGVVSIIDASGFDTVTARYIEQISAEAVTLKYKPGESTGIYACPVAGGTMILMGATDTADLPGGCCEYTLTWRGILVTVDGRDKKITKTRSVRERIFDSITGIVAGTAVRARILELQAGVSVRQIHQKVEPQPPALDGASQSPDGSGQNPGRGYNVIGATPTYCYPHGWICYSWQSEEQIPGIWFVSAEYKYEQAQTSG